MYPTPESRALQSLVFLQKGKEKAYACPFQPTRILKRQPLRGHLPSLSAQGWRPQVKDPHPRILQLNSRKTRNSVALNQLNRV